MRQISFFFVGLVATMSVNTASAAIAYFVAANDGPFHLLCDACRWPLAAGRLLLAAYRLPLAACRLPFAARLLFL